MLFLLQPDKLLNQMPSFAKIVQTAQDPTIKQIIMFRGKHCKKAVSPSDLSIHLGRRSVKTLTGSNK